MKLLESESIKYVYIGPDNHVHIFVPVINGTDIGTDDGPLASRVLRSCLGSQIDDDTNDSEDGDNKIDQSLIAQLQHYKKVLEHDIKFLSDRDRIKANKKERLRQVKKYIIAVEKLQKLYGYGSPFRYKNYPQSVSNLINQRSNLYTMILRPNQLNTTADFKNPVFSVDRSGKQIFYNILRETYKDLKVKHKETPRRILEKRVINRLEEEKCDDNDFEKYQKILQEEARELFHIEIDFPLKGRAAQAYIDNITHAEAKSPREPLGRNRYIKAMIDWCLNEPITPRLPVMAQKNYQSPFYMEDNDQQIEELTSIRTQFFLGIINIYCYAYNLSEKNFGRILDRNENLSIEIATRIKHALENGHDVEKIIFEIINNNAKTFSLMRPLNSSEIDKIKNIFSKYYDSIKKSQYYDYFTILCADKPGKFVTYQGCICVNLADLIKQELSILKDVDREYIVTTANLSDKLERFLPNTSEGSLTIYDIRLQDLEPKRLHEIVLASVSEGYVETLRRCKELGVDLKFKDENGNTLIHYAAQNTIDPKAVINFLQTEVGLDFFERNKNQCTALHYLAQRGCTKFFSVILSHLDDKDNKGYTPAHYAAENGHDDIISILPKSTLVNGDIGLAQVAAAKGHINVLIALRAKGIDLNPKDVGLKFKGAFSAALDFNQWDTVYFLVATEEDEKKKWNFFRKLLVRGGPYYQRRFLDSKWCSSLTIKQIIKIGLLRKELAYQHMWIIPNIGSLISIIADLNKEMIISLLSILGRNWLQSNIKTIYELNQILKVIKSMSVKKSLENLLGKQFIFSMLKDAALNNDLDSIKTYQENLKNLNEYRNETGGSLAHDITKNKIGACIILYIDVAVSIHDLRLYMMSNNLSAMYIVTPDKAFYVELATDEFIAIVRSQLMEAKKDIEFGEPLSDEQLDMIFQKTKHRYVTPKRMIEYLCVTYGGINIYHKDQSGNNFMHYAVTNLDLTISLMSILPTNVFFQMNEDTRRRPIDLLIKDSDTIETMEKCLMILKYIKAHHGHIDISEEDKGLAVFQHAIGRAVKLNRYKLVCFLLMNVRKKDVRWELFSKIILFFFNKELNNQADIFLNTLELHNINKLIKYSLEEEVEPDTETSHVMNALLQYAAKYDLVGESIKRLVSHRSMFTLDAGKKAVNIAAKIGNSNAVYFLLNRFGTAIITNNSPSPIEIANKNGHRELAKSMLLTLEQEKKSKQKLPDRAKRYLEPNPRFFSAYEEEDDPGQSRKIEIRAHSKK